MTQKRATAVASFIVVIFALGTFAATFFMPAAELIPAQVRPAKPEPGDSPLRSPTLMKLFEHAADVALKFLGYRSNMATLLKENPNLPFYTYAFFCGTALIAGALALGTVGREEAEEKTILPQRK